VNIVCCNVEDEKFEISQGSYELFFKMCIYGEKKQYRVTKK
jgi:hypothetical protein